MKNMAMPEIRLAIGTGKLFGGIAIISLLKGGPGPVTTRK